MVGVMISVGRSARSMAMFARWVLPVPVGSTTTPRLPESHQALRPSTWCGNASLATRSRHGAFSYARASS